MGGEEPGGDRSSRKDNSMTLSVRFKKGGRGTSLFFSVDWVIRFLELLESLGLLDLSELIE